MNKNIKNILFKAICLLIMLILLFPYRVNTVFALDSYPDKNPKDGGVTAPEEGEWIEIPSEMPQGGATYEAEDRSLYGKEDWKINSPQYPIYQLWIEQGRKRDNNHWAYVTIDGEDRYLVALSQFFGISGGYVDIYLENGERLPCLIADSKRLHEIDKNNNLIPDNVVGGTYWWTDGVQYGHTVSGGVCSIIEVITAGVSPNSDGYSIMSSLMSELTPVESIQYGGSWVDHPEGPVGLTGSNNSFEKKIIKAIVKFIMPFWESLCIAFENHMLNKDIEQINYDFNDKDDEDNVNNNNNNNGVQNRSCWGIPQER